jgi:isopenicillin-N N-acyltransferase-like protein
MESIPVVELKGSFAEMGESFGEIFRNKIQEFSSIRIGLTLKRCRKDLTEEELLNHAREFVKFQSRKVPDIHGEFMGIAKGADIVPERLLIGNGFTDYRDAACSVFRPMECTSFMAKQEACRDGSFVGQTWDMSTSAEDYVVLVKRDPEKGPRTMALTTTGCLSLIGINEHGICIGNNNLIPTDARTGLIYLAMIHKTLSCTSFEEACEWVKQSPLSSAHHYYVAAPGDTIASIERSATQFAELAVDPVRAHTNHFIAPELLAYEYRKPSDPDKSVGRLERAEELLETAKGSIDADTFMSFLRDTADAPRRICIDFDDNDTKTCAAVFFDVEKREMYALKGPPNQGDFGHYTF